MADVGRHAGDVAGRIVTTRARPAGRAVLDVPDDLVGQLDEPLDAVVAVVDRQDVLLGGRAEQAVACTTEHTDGFQVTSERDR